jgi:hypothetical protein
MVSPRSLRSTKPLELSGFYFPNETWATDGQEHSRKVFQLLEISDIVDSSTCTINQGKATYSYPEGELVEVFSESILGFIEDYLEEEGVYSITPKLEEANATVDIDDSRYIVGAIFRKSFEQMTPYDKKVKGELFDFSVSLLPNNELSYSLTIGRGHFAPGLANGQFSADRHRHYKITNQVIVDGVLQDEYTKTQELRYGVRNKKEEPRFRY